MSELSKQALRVENNQQFPNNNAGLITPSNLRAFNEDMIDSTVNQATYTSDSSSFDIRIGESVTTASLTGDTITFEKENGNTFDITITGASLPSGVVSGSSQIDYPLISNIPSGIISSSEQLPAGLVSGSSQLTSSYDTRYVLSGSVQPLPSGVVSGSSQIILQDTTGDLSGSRIDGAVSLATNAVSSSYAVTASFALNAGGADTGSLLVTASNDFSQITFTKGDASTFELDVTPRRVVETVKNKNGFMQKGTPVYVSGSTGNELHVYLADAGNSLRVPATFILDQDLDTNESGLGILSGFINGVDTSLFAEGSNIYLAVGGGYTDVQPTGSAFIQKLGNVVKSDLNGSGVISGAGRVNALPNLQQGYAWVGNSDGVPLAVSTGSFAGTTIDTGSFATTGSNLFNGTQIIENTTETSRGVEVKINGGTNQYLRIGPVDGNSGNMAMMITGSDEPAGQKVWGINTAGGIWRNTFFSNVTFADDIIARNNVNISWQGGTTEADSRQGVNHISESVQVYTGLSEDGHYIVSSSVDERIIDVNPTTATVTIANTITSQIFLNPQTLTGTQTVPTGFNGMLTGDVSNAGTIVIEGGANLVII